MLYLQNRRTSVLHWQASQVVVQQPEQVGLLLMVLCVPLGVVRARVVWQLHLERSIQRRLPRCAYEDTVRAQAAEGGAAIGRQ